MFEIEQNENLVYTPYIGVTPSHSITFYSPGIKDLYPDSLKMYDGNKNYKDYFAFLYGPRTITLANSIKFIVMPCLKSRISECYIKDNTDDILIFGHT